MSDKPKVNFANKVPNFNPNKPLSEFNPRPAVYAKEGDVVLGYIVQDLGTFYRFKLATMLNTTGAHEDISKQFVSINPD